MKFKKIILSSFVVLAFAVYAVYQRLGGSYQIININSDSSSSTPTNTETQIPGLYKDGEYVGASVYTIFGNVQVSAVISGGKIFDVKFLKYPNDRDTSIQISNTSLPLLKTEAIAVQSAKVDIVSGATQTSEGFIESLASALAQAKK